jgi:hypothetical protein
MIGIEFALRARNQKSNRKPVPGWQRLVVERAREFAKEPYSLATGHKLVKRLESSSFSLYGLERIEVGGVIFDGDSELPRAVCRTQDRAMNRNRTIRLAVIAMPNHVGERLFEAEIDGEAQLSR